MIASQASIIVLSTSTTNILKFQVHNSHLVSINEHVKISSTLSHIPNKHAILKFIGAECPHVWFYLLLFFFFFLLCLQKI